MRYKQFKFKFYLNARHAIYMDHVLGNIHPHTWEITCNVLKSNNEFVPFDEVIQKVESFMSTYQDQYLNELEPFNRINPTLENCCEYFKDKFTEIFQKEGWSFLMIEMSETPTRSYVISLIDERESMEEQSVDALTDELLKRLQGEVKE